MKILKSKLYCHGKWWQPVLLGAAKYFVSDDGELRSLHELFAPYIDLIDKKRPI